MTYLIKELKKAMKQKNISAETMSRYIGCSARTVNRWLYNESVPSSIYQRLIRAGLKKIREAYPSEKESIYDLSLRARGLWRKIKHDMTIEERAELGDINDDKGIEAYIKRLQELVEKYGKKP